ncbi:MAG: patatin-like phospholipase family protein [Firmicutes bacterium]|nr:patatin-like phospholipase family protein [Bacillota bacterium]
MLCDIAFMGGGVRGIAFVGAVKALESAGYKVRRVAGTSAGAIVAALLAAGYCADEMRAEMEALNYLNFKSRDHRNFGVVSEFFHLRRDLGVYSADYFEAWIDGLLAKKGKRVFGDLWGGAIGGGVRSNSGMSSSGTLGGQPLSQYEKALPLQLTASDIVNKRLLILPQDLALFGLDPNSFSIAKAVRMSMSIPLFYEPYRLKDTSGCEHLIVDGGLFCNYPIWLLDDGCKKPDVAVFGARFVETASKESKGGSSDMYAESGAGGASDVAKQGGAGVLKSVSCAINNVLSGASNFVKNDVLKLTNYIKVVLNAVLDAQGHGYARVTKGDARRTINIPVAVTNQNGSKKIVKATDFNLDQKTAESLFNNGLSATKNFLKNWNFDNWRALRT